MSNIYPGPSASMQYIKFAISLLLQLANNILNAGYFGSGGLCEQYFQVSSEDSRVVRGAEMAVLAGAIYNDAVSEMHGLGHSVVAEGTSQNVRWIVTDHVHEGVLERVITIKVRTCNCVANGDAVSKSSLRSSLRRGSTRQIRGWTGRSLWWT